MSCDAHNQRLMELVLGELPEESATATRAHAASCAKCGAELAELTAVMAQVDALPLAEPPPHVDAAVLARAASRAAVLRGEQPAAPAFERAAAPGGSWWSRLRELGRLASGPQLAMVAVMVLVVSVGVWSRSAVLERAAVEQERAPAPATLPITKLPEEAAAPAAQVEPPGTAEAYAPRAERSDEARTQKRAGLAAQEALAARGRSRPIEGKDAPGSSPQRPRKRAAASRDDMAELGGLEQAPSSRREALGKGLYGSDEPLNDLSDAPSAAAASPMPKKESGAALASTLLAKGEALARQGKCSEAVVLFGQAAARSASSIERARAYRAQAQCYLALGDSAAAARAANLAEAERAKRATDADPLGGVD